MTNYINSDIALPTESSLIRMRRFMLENQYLFFGIKVMFLNTLWTFDPSTVAEKEDEKMSTEVKKTGIRNKEHIKKKRVKDKDNINDVKNLHS